MDQGYIVKCATANVNNGAASATAITCPTSNIKGATAKISVVSANITVTLAATGGGGLVNILDGSTIIISVPAAATGFFPVYFGENGYQLTAGNNLAVAAASAITNQATAVVALTGYVVGG